MEKILVSGLINIETAVRVAGFPIHYAPVHYPFWGVRSTVSGVGYNIAKALTTLGQSIRFLSLVGDDLAGEMVLQTADKAGIPTTDCLRLLGATAQSAILYDPDGRRQIHGDALFSSFLHAYSRTGDPYTAIRQAMVFASYKIGVAGAAEGFLTAPELTAWVERASGQDIIKHGMVVSNMRL
jgi:sugar/nucleoside kinase (ribokinase family)